MLLGPDEAVCAKSFRNISGVLVLGASEAGVVDVVGARTLVLSEAAITALRTLAAEPKPRVAQEAA